MNNTRQPKPATMRDPLWYLHRLGRMSIGEVVYRLKGLGSAQFGRLGNAGIWDPGTLALGSERQWLGAGPGHADRCLLEHANELVDGQVRLFSSRFPLDFRWNRDPMTGVDGPSTYGLAIDVHSRRLVGDIKYLWELNRHHSLATVAQAYGATRDSRYLDFLRRALTSWLEQCPYPRGPNWSSSLEAAIRLINWTAVWQWAGGARGALLAEPEGRSLSEMWQRSIAQHAYFIQSHYSKYSSANNHLIGEAAGVFIATCTWPEFPRAVEWRQKAQSILAEEGIRQISSDGVLREQTTAYSKFVLEFFLLSVLAGRASCTVFPATLLERIEALLRFIVAITDSKGHVPMIGDADDGCVLKTACTAIASGFEGVIALGSRLLGLPDLVAGTGAVPNAISWFVREDNQPPYMASVRESHRQSFPEGGYYILGNRLGQLDEVRCLVDAGPLGYLSIAAHGHADALALYLSVAGREFLIDPGTFTYHCAPQWRAYFRGTRAHNTVTVDGLDQSIQGGGFLWTRRANATCIAFQQGASGDLFIGEHDGYSRLPDPVIHRREVRRFGGAFQVTDRIECAKEHSVEQWWHFSEACHVRVEESRVLATNDGVALVLVPNNRASTICLYRGSTDPLAGWISRSYAVKVPAYSVCVASQTDGPTELITRIECSLPGHVN